MMAMITPRGCRPSANKMEYLANSRCLRCCTTIDEIRNKKSIEMRITRLRKMSGRKLKSEFSILWISAFALRAMVGRFVKMRGPATAIAINPIMRFIKIKT